jgi:hypothetical protein
MNFMRHRRGRFRHPGTIGVRGAGSAGEGDKYVVPKLDLFPRVECSVPEDSLVKLAWRSASSAPMCEREVIEEEQLAVRQADLHDNGVDQ